MKNWIVLLMLFIPLFANAQDKVVLRSGDTLNVKIQKSTDDKVEYTFPNETTLNEKSKKEIVKVIYSSGREEKCNTKFEIPTINGESDWKNVVITYLPSDVEGLTRVSDVKATSMWGGSMGSSIGYKGALNKLKRRAAKLNAGVILITSQPNQQAAAMGGGVQVVGIAYK
jgi:hypothetical protein